MPTPVNIQSELDRHRTANVERVKHLVDQQYNTEIIRGFQLEFTSSEESDAVGLGRLLFAKGFRLLTPVPEAQAASGWRTRVGVKRSLREITSEDFLCDLITLASGVHSCLSTWDLLADDAAEQTQAHTEPPVVRGQPQ